MPGRMVTGKVDYYACFHDLPDGLQTHCFAPMGLDIRARWRVGGALPGEPREPDEIGLGLPKEGLYLREDVTMKCNIMLTSFVKKTFKKSHERLVARLAERTHVTEIASRNERNSAGGSARGSSGGMASPSIYSSYGSPAPAAATPAYPYGAARPASPGQPPYYQPQPGMAGMDIKQNPYGAAPPPHFHADPAYAQHNAHLAPGVAPGPPQPGQAGWEQYQMWMQMQQQAVQQHGSQATGDQKVAPAHGGAVEMSAGELPVGDEKVSSEKKGGQTAFPPAELQG